MTARVQPVLLVVAVVLVVDLLLVVTDTGPDIPAVTALGLTIGAAWWFVRDVGSTACRPRPATAGPPPLEHRPDLRMTTLRQALAYGDNDHYLTERVHATLVAVVDDELRATHGVDRRGDPGAAAAILGPDLVRFVDDPDAAASMTTRSLTRIVTLIEGLRADDG